MALPPCQFSCRITDIDYYTAAPVKDLDVCYSESRSSVVDKVPVVRIFGATPVGQKTCLHIHGVFPYIYVPCLCPDPNEQYLEQVAKSIDYALQVSLGATSKTATHVFKISIVKGIPFYGYHESEESFLKVYLCNPTLIRRLSDLLLAGAVMNQVLQPHEAHIPFPLQFMIDYNLFGMNYIHLSAMKFRLGGEKGFSQGSQGQQSLASPLTPSPMFCSPSQAFWDVDNLPRDMVVCVPRVSVCELEADGLAADILNRHELSMASGGYPGLAAIWEEEKQRRLLLDNNASLSPPPSPERAIIPLFPAEQRWRDELDDIVIKRLGISSDSDLSDFEEPPPTLHLSQSCDIEVHRPIGREEGDSVAKQPDQVETLVDEGVVHQSMELSQKLSMETIRKCTDAELLDLMLDLCQTPDSQQPSQSCYNTQTIAQSLAARMRRSQSTTSSSLFSSPPYSCSTPAKCTGGPEETGNEEGRDLSEVAGMDFLNTSIHSPVSTLTTDDGDDDDYENDEERVKLTATETQRGQEEDIADVPTAGGDAGALVTGDLQLGDTEFQLSLDVSLTEEPNPIETHSSLSPDSMDMEGTFGEEGEISDSQFDIPCAQVPSSQEDTAVLSQSDASDADLKSEVCSDKGSLQDGTYLSVLEDPLVSAVEHHRAPATSILGPDVFSFSQFDSSSQIPPAQISTSQRRRLLQLCSQEDVEDEGEREESESGDSEEDKDYWLSQEVWEDISSAQQQQSSAGEIPSHQPEKDEDLWKTLLSDTIPQLDGSTGPPKGGKRETKKTLKRKRRQVSLHTHRPPDVLSPMCTSDTLSDKDTAAPSSTVTGTESSDSELAKATVSKKARPSLSLRKKLPKVSKDSMTAHSSADYIKKDLGLPSSVGSLSAHPLASRLKRRALTHCLRPHVKRLNMSQVAKGLSEVKKAVSCSDSGVEEKQPQRRRRRRRTSKYKSWGSVVPPGWSKTLRTRYIGRGGGGGEGRGGEDEEVALSPELIVGLEKYSYKDQLQTAIEESLKSSGESSTKPTTSADDTASPMRGGVGSSTEGEKFHTTSEIETETVTSVPQTTFVEATSLESEKLDTGTMPKQSLDPERCTMSPDDLDVTVVAESPFGSPRVAVDSASMTPGRCLRPPLEHVESSEHVESLARREPAVSASSSQYDTAAEPIPKPEELESFFESAPLVDRAGESVEGNGGNLDVNLAESDFQLTLTASDTDTESEDAMSVSVEREGVPERHHWHLEATAMECTSAERATDDSAVVSQLGATTVLRSSLPPPLPHEVILKYSLPPPLPHEVMETASSYGVPRALHIKPFYSNPSDVQPAKNIGGKVLRVPSRMPYDLKEFDPPYLTPIEGLSTTGLQHMRTVLSMLRSVHSGTQPILPPPCRPTRETNTHHYTAEDHKNDTKLRSTFFKANKVVVTSATVPPHPQEVAAWCERLRLSVTKATEGSSCQVEDSLQGKDGDGAQVGANRKNLTVIQSRTEPLSDDEAKDTEPLSVDDDAKNRTRDQNELEPSFTALEGDVLMSPPSVQSVTSPGSSGSCGEQSLTSYQPPRPTSLIKECVHLPLVDQVPFHSCPNEPDPSNTAATRTATSLDGSPDEAFVTSSPPPFHSTPVVACDDVGRDLDNLTPVRTKEPAPNKHRSEITKLPFTPFSELKRDTSQLEGPTPNNTYGFKVSQSALPQSCDSHEVQYLTSMSVELHIRTRSSLRPDPECDPILAVFYYIHNDWPGVVGGGEENAQLGVMAIDVDTCNFSSVTPVKGKKEDGESRGREEKLPPKSPTKGATTLKSPAEETLSPLGASFAGDYLAHCGISSDVAISYASSEVELIERVTQLVRSTDPDFLVGFEIATLSWGYLVDRAATLNINLAKELSRIPNFPGVKQHSASSGRELHIPGRIMLNVWRLLKHEVALNIYTFENLAFHVLHQRIPLFSFQTLTSWYEHRTKLYRHRVVEHYVRRCHGNYKLLQSFNLIGRTSEFARLYGIEFVNVLSRGTQYRVEAMMLRLAKPANYIAVSPSIQQRARMAAPECLPLILEPESKFYADPVVVLDFQSLYPSMVIAYNYCFSTCLGRVRNLAVHGDYTLGTNSLNVPSHVLKRVKGNIHISPNGAMFVKPCVRRGIMPRMLEEILGTRIMVKSSMKLHKKNKALGKMLDARQLGLKMIANVTYGYTAANFSGRMPCVEIADSIVQKGRETLERAIQLVNSTPEWRARVVYGDTDSLFVLLKGASKEEAFRVGREITERVTAMNPKPVKLKFEKVYLPCILQTKKRYVGFMYESPEQVEPLFDAKGIETVRRDTCPAVAKVLEKSLRLLFSSRDLSQVKTYVQRQCSKLLDGHVSIQEYTFAKEYRGKSNYRPGACVPALELTKQSLAVDRCSEPRVGERVPYVIVYGTPGQPLIQLVRRPEDVAGNPSLRLNGMYYITKQILPTLDRAFSLMGVDVRQWYTELPRVFRAPTHVPQESSHKLKGTIGQYFATMHCPICEQLTVEGVCGRCREDPQKVAAVLSSRMAGVERSYHTIKQLCQDCVGSLDSAHFSACVSLDCPVYHSLCRAKQELAGVDSMREQLQNALRLERIWW